MKWVQTYPSYVLITFRYAVPVNANYNFGMFFDIGFTEHTGHDQ